MNEKVHVIDHPLLAHKMTILRDKNTSVKDFRELVSEIGMLITYEATRDLPLTDKEIETLPLGAKLMTLECGVRFLTDYLNGDTYFAISRPEQNLDRARTQLKLVEDMEAKWDEMNAIIARLKK